MTTVRQRGLMVSSLCALLLAGSILAGCESGRLPRPPASLGAAINRAVPADIASLPLTDDQGQATSLASYHGKVVVLTDILTLCQDVCPLTSANYEAMDQAVAKQGLTSKVQFVELTVDPERDTPARLAAYRRIFNAPANWSLLTASPQVTARVWKFFGAFYQRVPEENPPGIDWWTHRPLTYDVDHEDVLVYLDPAGHERFLIVGLPNTLGRQPPPALQQFLSDLGRQHLVHPAPTAWTVPQALMAMSWVLGIRVPPSS
jgi:protein SCO1